MKSPICSVITLAALTIALCSSYSAAAPACHSWEVPKKQSRNALYSADGVYGRLGIRVGFRSVYLIENSGCYEMSDEGLSTFRFYFNNAIDEDADSEPTFLAVTSIRTYRYPMGGYDHPILATFYRNGNELEGAGRWALPSQSISSLSQGSQISENEITYRDKRYEPDDTGSVDSIDQVFSLIDDLSNNLVRDWHALLVAENDDSGSDKRTIARNSYQTRHLWKVDSAKINLIAGGSAIARNYLIKFRDSPSPKKKVFFRVENLGGAQCLYVKIFRPGRDGPLLGLSDQSGDIIVFKLDKSAEC